MVMVHPSENPVASWEFEGEILILHHPTTISVKYQAMSKCQTAALVMRERLGVLVGVESVFMLP